MKCDGFEVLENSGRLNLNQRRIIMIGFIQKRVISGLIELHYFTLG